MSDKTDFRLERITRLLEELRYEITRGMMEGEIDERIGYQFVVPVSKTYPSHGVVVCKLETRPIESRAFFGGPIEPRLKIVK